MRTILLAAALTVCFVTAAGAQEAGPGHALVPLIGGLVGTALLLMVFTTPIWATALAIWVGRMVMRPLVSEVKGLRGEVRQLAARDGGETAGQLASVAQQLYNLTSRLPSPKVSP